MAEKCRRIAIYGNWNKPGMSKILSRIAIILRSENVEALIEPGGVSRTSARLSSGMIEVENPARESDLILSIGGDGTLLRVVRETMLDPHPILGINTGTLGFLTEIDTRTPDELETGLRLAMSGEFQVDHRMRILAKLETVDGVITEHTALNEVAILRNSLSRMAEVEVKINGEHLTTYFCDGLILSTPTGSTAHSLSAGGPVVMPGLDTFLIIPICSHSLSVRAIMISGNDEVEIKLRSKKQCGIGAVDGQQTFKFSVDDRLLLGRAENDALLVRIWGRSFFDIMRQKFHWGGAVRGE